MGMRINFKAQCPTHGIFLHWSPVGWRCPALEGCDFFKPFSRKKREMRAYTYCMEYVAPSQLCHNRIPLNERVCPDCKKRKARTLAERGTDSRPKAEACADAPPAPSSPAAAGSQGS